MPNINAALGCAQLEQLPKKLKAKRDLFSAYQSSISKISNIKIIKEPKNCRSNYRLQTIKIENY